MIAGWCEIQVLRASHTPALRPEVGRASGVLGGGFGLLAFVSPWTAKANGRTDAGGILTKSIILAPTRQKMRWQ